jgi:hypothetical protein
VPKRSLTWPKVHTELDDSSVSSRTRARPRANLDHLAEPPLFEKLSTTFTHPQATAEIRKRIEKQLGERETESGIVYVYRRPDCELLKIGFTGGATTKPRMDSIKKVCRYDPESRISGASAFAQTSTSRNSHFWSLQWRKRVSPCS